MDKWDKIAADLNDNGGTDDIAAALRRAVDEEAEKRADWNVVIEDLERQVDILATALYKVAQTSMGGYVFDRPATAAIASAAIRNARENQ